MAQGQGGSATPAKVLVVDDQMLYREGLAGLMGHWPEFKVVGDAGNGEEAVSLTRRLRPDLVLMDVSMPVMGGIEATGLIHAFDPRVLVVMLTVSVDEETLYQAFCQGAVGYVLKDTSSGQLRAHLQAAVRGEMVLSGMLVEKLIKRFMLTSPARAGVQQAHADPDVPLTEREVELLRLVAQGLSNDEIAAQMYISFGTVKKNLQALMQKLQVPNRVMLAGYAIRAGLAD